MARGRAQLSSAGDTSADETPVPASRTRRQTARRTTRMTPGHLAASESVPEAEPSQAEAEPAPLEKLLPPQPSPSFRSRLSARFSAQRSASRTSRHPQSPPAPTFCVSTRAWLSNLHKWCTKLVDHVCTDLGRTRLCNFRSCMCNNAHHVLDRALMTAPAMQY